MEELGRLEERVILIGVQTAAEDNVLDSLDELEVRQYIPVLISVKVK